MVSRGDQVASAGKLTKHHQRSELPFPASDGARNRLFVALLQQDRTGRARDDRLVREDAHQVRPALDLPAEPFRRAPAVWLASARPAVGLSHDRLCDFHYRRALMMGGGVMPFKAAWASSAIW